MQDSDCPTAYARQDRLQPKETYINNETGYSIYVGPNGRTHIFTADDKYHTSFITTRRNRILRTSIREIASIKMLDIEMSEDEFDVCEKCLEYVLQSCSPDEIEAVSGATQAELDEIWRQMATTLRKHTDLRESPSTSGRGV